MTDDPFLWLEEVEGTAALRWVREQNARSLALLEGDPRYAEMYREALAVVTAPDRIPYPSFLGDRLVNFLQDYVPVRGFWPATILAAFPTARPDLQEFFEVGSIPSPERLHLGFPLAA